MHVLKCGVGDYGSVRDEAERAEGFHSKVGTIDPELTPQNYRLIDRKPPKNVDEYIQSLGVKRKIRLDAVRCASIIVDYPKDETRPPREFFEDAKKGLQEYFGVKDSAVLWANVHVDEGHPHMHFAFVPLTEREKTYKDGRTEMQVKLSAFDVLTKESLLELHPFMQQYMDERGYKGTLHYADGKKRDKEFMEHKLEQMAKELEREGTELADTSQRLSEAREEEQKRLGNIKSLKRQESDFRANLSRSRRTVAQINEIKGEPATNFFGKPTGDVLLSEKDYKFLKRLAIDGAKAEPFLKAKDEEISNLSAEVSSRRGEVQQLVKENVSLKQKLQSQNSILGKIKDYVFNHLPEFKPTLVEFLEGKGKGKAPEKKISQEAR